jgi:excisionase family DNA binding protein
MEPLEVQVPESYGVAIHVQAERDPACVGQEAARTRFLTIEQAAEELNVSLNQIRALLKTGELRAIQIGGRGYLWQIHQSRRCFPIITAHCY